MLLVLLGQTSCIQTYKQLEPNLLWTHRVFWPKTTHLPHFSKYKRRHLSLMVAPMGIQYQRIRKQPHTLALLVLPLAVEVEGEEGRLSFGEQQWDLCFD